MTAVLDELIQLLALEKLEQNLFRGQSQDLGWGRVFGGQVVGQALSAAAQTVPADRRPHSMHAYFLRPGDVTRPIIYEVDRIRDGSSFTTRRVVAVQNGSAIFTMAASFQVPEEGFDHQEPMPASVEPDTVPSQEERIARIAGRLPRMLRERAAAKGPFELRIVEPEDDPFLPQPRPPRRQVWLRAAGPLPDDPALHAYLLAYASDHAFVTTALLPHGVTWLTPGIQVASIDHAMWFHRPLRVDEWLLYDIDSPSAHGARGLVRGEIFSRGGKLVASCSQEGLLRQRS